MRSTGIDGPAAWLHTHTTVTTPLANGELFGASYRWVARRATADLDLDLDLDLDTARL